MNLNDLYEGREPYQQAIDKLEARRIEDLEAKMDDLATRAKESTDPKVKQALRHEFAKAKAERDSYHKLNVEEVADTNYTYTVYIDGNKEGTYGSKEEAKAVVNRKKEQAPGRDYRIKPKSRTSMSSIKKFQRNRDYNLDEHGGGVNDVGGYVAWRRKANKERGITKGNPPVGKPAVEEWMNTAAGEPEQDELIKVEGYATTVSPNMAPLDKEKQWKIKIRQLVADYIKNPQGLYNIAKQRGPNSPEAYAYNQIMHPTGKLQMPPNAITFEGFQDFKKVEPYAVCLAGKPVKTFDYYEQARQFHDNWKRKLDREGNKAKADKITLMPVMKEDIGSWIVYDPETKQIKKRFKTHTAGKSYAKAHGLGFASSEYYFDNVKEPAMDESIVGRAQSKSLDDKVKKLVWDTLKIDADDGKQAAKKGLAVLANKPQSRMVRELEELLSDLSHKLAMELPEGSMAAAAHHPDGPKFTDYWKGTDKSTPGTKMVGGSMEEGIAGNMTARSNPLTQPLRKRNFVAKNAQISGAGKHNNNLKAAQARGQAKHKGKAFELDEMTNDEVAKIRKDAEAGIKSTLDKQSDARIAALKNPPKEKSFMQKVGDKQIGMVKGAWRGLTGKLEESDNFLTWAVRNGFNINKPEVYESAKKEFKALVEDCGPIAPHETYYGAMDETKKVGTRVQIVKGSEAGQTGTIGEIRPGAYKGAPGYYTVDLDNGGHIQVRKEALRVAEVEEGWKSKVAGAALAGAAALGAGGAHARVMPGDDPNINRFTGAPVTQTAQSDATDTKVTAPGFSREYLQKVANGEHPRPMLSKEKAQQLLSQMDSGKVNESLKQGEYYVWTVYFDDGSSKRIKVKSDEFDPYEYYAKQNKSVVNVDYSWDIHQ